MKSNDKNNNTSISINSFAEFMGKMLAIGPLDKSCFAVIHDTGNGNFVEDKNQSLLSGFSFKPNVRNSIDVMSPKDFMKKVNGLGIDFSNDNVEIIKASGFDKYEICDTMMVGETCGMKSRFK